jgi:phenylpropionate dioxygenase-like ring-hydroxylating dioxygenase large terminal subunit
MAQTIAAAGKGGMMRARAPSVRPDFVPADAYIRPEYVEIEAQTLWPRTWLIAAREEELKRAGDYVVFDIGRESILIVRGENSALRAFYNVCRHRGRRLKDDPFGHTSRFIRCGFHGWTYRLDGSILSVLHREDWKGCADFTDEALRLRELRLETWAGWIWVTMDADIEPLREYLGPVAAALDPFEFEHCRYAWYQTIVVPCNWKVIIDAFNEAYHVPATHPNMFKYGWPGSHTATFGRHGAFFQHNAFFQKSAAAGDGAQPVPLRERLDHFFSSLYERAHSMVAPYTLKAAKRLAELPDDTDDMSVLTRFGELQREEMEKTGARWPEGLTPNRLAEAPTDFHIFPNTTVVPLADGALWHRMRPNGDDPGSAIWDIWSLERFAPGGEPELKREFFPSPQAFRGRNPFLEEDFSNMEAVQKGMWSRSFQGARTNPVQESTVSNFHRVLYDYYHGRQEGA